jgi:hypothetical protein
MPTQVIRPRRLHPTTGIRHLRMIPAILDLTDLDPTKGRAIRRIKGRAIHLTRGRAIHRRRHKISSTSRARTLLKATDPLNIATEQPDGNESGYAIAPEHPARSLLGWATKVLLFVRYLVIGVGRDLAPRSFH